MAEVLLNITLLRGQVSSLKSLIGIKEGQALMVIFCDITRGMAIK